MSNLKLIHAVGIGGGTLLGIGLNLLSKVQETPDGQSNRLSEAERREIFSKNAFQWDGMVRWTELSSGLFWWRRKLCKLAYGDILEVAIGSGRNLKYYDKNKVKTITAVDYSRPMLEVSLKKKGSIPLRLICSTVTELSNYLPEAHQFDCVVDTFGLCSFEDPIAALKEMSRLCKPGGRILLLEHGESTWEFVRNYLNKSLGEHIKKYGCYHNRPIEEIVKAAGLEIVAEKRKHFGSIYLLVCKPAAVP